MYDTPHPMDDDHARTQKTLWQQAIDQRVNFERAPKLGPARDAALQSYLGAFKRLANHCGLSDTDQITLNECLRTSARTLMREEEELDFVEGHRVYGLREPLACKAPPAAVNELAWR